MMAKNDNVIGLAIGLDTSSLKAGLQDAGRRMKEAEATFKAASSGMQDWTKSSEGLQAKLQQLNTNLAVQSAALDLMEEEYKKMYEGQDENSAAAIKLRTEILNQQAAIGRTEKSIAKYNDSLDALNNKEETVKTNLELLTDTIGKQEASLKQLESEYKNAVLTYGANSTEALELANALKTTSAELEDNKNKLNATSEALSNLSKKAEEPKTAFETLKNVITEQEADLKKLEDAYQNAVLTYGKNSSEAINLANAIKKTSNELADNKNKVKETSDALADLSKKAEEPKSAFDKLNDELDEQQKELDELKNAYVGIVATQGSSSKEAKQLAKQIENLSGELKDNKQQFDRAKDSANKLDKTFEEVEDGTNELKEGFTILKGTIAGLLASGISKLFSMFSTGVQSMLSSTEATREYRTELGKLGAVADTTGTELDDAKENLREVVSITNDSGAAVEGLNNLMSAGFKGDMLDEVTDQLLAASIKWKDTLKFEGLSDGLQETLATGKAIGPFAEMLERGGINLEEFDEGLAQATTDAEKQAYILNYLNKMGLTPTLDSYKENNKELIEANKINQDYLDTQAKLGEAMQPVNNALTNFKNELLQVVLSEVDFKEASEVLTDILNKVKDEVIPKVIEGIKWLKDNFDEIKAAVIALGAGFAALKIAGVIAGVVKAVKTWTTVTKGMTVAQRALNLAQAANPIGLIVTAIAGLITWLVYLYQTNEEFRDKVDAVWEQIKNFFIDAWEEIKVVWDKVKPYFQLIWDNIKLIFSVVKNVLSGNFKEAWEAIKGIFNNYKTYFNMVWSGIKTIFSKVGTWFSEKFSEAWTSIKKAFGSVGTFFGGIWKTIKDKFTDIGQKVGNAVSGAFKKAVNSLLSNAEKVLNKPIKAINKLRTIINKVPGIDISKLDEFTLPRLALGGVVDKATTALIGEDGQEAVIPLERNLGWMKKLSSNIVKEMNLAGVSSGMSNNYSTVNNFTQNITTPKQPPLDDLYRTTKNLFTLKAVNA